MTDASITDSATLTLPSRATVVANVRFAKVNFGLLGLTSVILGMALLFAAVYAMIINLCLSASCEPISLSAQVVNYGLFTLSVVSLGISLVSSTIAIIKNSGRTFAVPAVFALAGFVCFIIWG